jgi:excisionase family DNA binding protein
MLSSPTREPDAYSVKEAARRFRVSDSTVRLAIRRGDLPVVRLSRTLRVPRVAVERMLLLDEEGSLDPTHAGGAPAA